MLIGEQLSRTERPVVSISAAAGSSIVLAETTYQVNQRALQQHVTGLRQTISTRLPGVEVQEAQGNLFGLAYTPCCWADLTVTG